jgi:phage terminase small subunit
MVRRETSKQEESEAVEAKSKTVRKATSKARSTSKRASSAKSAEAPQVDKAKKIFRDIKGVLEKLQLYSKMYDSLIMSCAQMIYLRDEAYRSMLENGVTVEERTSVGEKRLKINPAFNAYRDTTKELRGALNDLAMNVRASMAPTEDQLDRLTDKLDNITQGQ